MQDAIRIDRNIRRWGPVFDAYREGREPACPCCGSHDVEATVKDPGGGIGYALFECRARHMAGWFSRVRI